MKDKLQSTHFVVVTYNGAKFIERCIRAIRIESPQSPIHVLDNGSTDKTLEILSKLKISPIQTNSNLGFGRANNLGISQALKLQAENVFLINQDAYIQKGALKNFFCKPESQSVNLHAFLQLNGDGTRIDQNFKSSYLQDESCPGLLDDLLFNRVQSSYTIRFTNAAAWMMPRNLLFQLGGFNPSFFHYGEDDNFVNRLHYHGFKMLLHPDCVVHHDRENRPKSPYFDDTPQKERLFLQQITSPSNKLGSNEILKRVRLNYWKKRLRGLKKSNIIERIQLDFLTTNSIKDIVKNRELTKTRGPHFLNM